MCSYICFIMQCKVCMLSAKIVYDRMYVSCLHMYVAYMFRLIYIDIHWLLFFYPFIYSRNILKLVEKKYNGLYIAKTF